MVAQVLAAQAAEDDHRQRAEQHGRQQSLAARLAPGDQRRQEDAGGEVRRRHEEDRHLEVPGSGQVVRQQLGQVDPEEAAGLDHVMHGRAPDQVLEQEERGHDQEEPGGHALGGRQGHGGRRHEPHLPLLGLVPADEPRMSAVHAQDQAAAPQERHQRQGAPHDRVARERIADQLLGGPVVRVRVGLAGPAGHARPGRPGDEGGDRAGVLGVGDHARLEPLAAHLPAVHQLAEVVVDLLEGRDLPGGPDQRPRLRVVAVGLQLAPGPRLGRLVVAVPLVHVQGHAVQVIGREIRPEVGTVAVHGAELHQPVGEELLLPVEDLLPREQHVARLVHDPLGDRRIVLVDPDRREGQEGEPDDERQDRSLQPERRDRHGAATCHADDPGSREREPVEGPAKPRGHDSRSSSLIKRIRSRTPKSGSTAAKTLEAIETRKDPDETYVLFSSHDASLGPASGSPLSEWVSSPTEPPKPTGLLALVRRLVPVPDRRQRCCVSRADRHDFSPHSIAACAAPEPARDARRCNLIRRSGYLGTAWPVV